MKKWAMVSLGVVFIFTQYSNLYSQDTASPFQLDSATVAGMSDLDVMLQAVESVPPMPAQSLPDAGTYWSAQHAPGSAEEWPPLPSNFGMGAWSLGDDGVYLLDDRGFVWGQHKKARTVLTTASGLTLRTSDAGMDPADAGDDTNGDGSGGSLSPVVAYGTNLWLLTPKPSPFSPAVFNDSELQGYKASTALTTCLNGLKTRFPNYRLNILAHSQGNTVVSEAIKQGFTSFDTYILTQGALPDSAYDVNAPTNSTLLTLDGAYPTPEWQPMGYFCISALECGIKK
jgi:hypothetical protein